MTHSAHETHAGLLTVRETAQALRVSEEPIRRRFDDGDVRGVRLGSVRRILASELERLASPAHGEASRNSWGGLAYWKHLTSKRTFFFQAEDGIRDGPHRHPVSMDHGGSD